MRINGFTIKGETESFQVSAIMIELMVLYEHETLMGMV